MAPRKIRRRGEDLFVTIPPSVLRRARLGEGDLVELSVEQGSIVLTPADGGTVDQADSALSEAKLSAE